MQNRALFDCDADGGDAGFDSTTGHVVHFRLRDSTGVSSWILMVWSEDMQETGIPILDNPPRASKGAPLMVLTGTTTGQSVAAATPASEILSAALPAGTNSWIVRSVVNGGMSGAPSAPDMTLIHERMVVVKNGSGFRKPVVTETMQYEVDSWAGALCDIIGA